MSTDKKKARRNSNHHFSVLFFIGLEFYDVIQLTVEKLAERIQGIGRDGFVRLHPADGRTADTGLGLQGICGCAMPLMVCHKGSYEIIPGRFLHFLLYISLLLPIMEE